MEISDIQRLCALDNGFYRANAESFARSRRTAWLGWNRVSAHLRPSGGALELLDIASGTMRFEAFLRERLSDVAVHATCVDSCPELARSDDGIDFIEHDVIAGLLGGSSLGGRFGSAFDAAVSFGFMHHVPTAALREAFVCELVRCVRPAGTVALSFWRFMDDERLASKALATTRQALGELDVPLEEGDYFLGWDGQPGALRYCHHFTEEEISRLAAAVSDEADVIERFDADGRTGSLNGYVVFRRR